MIAVEPGPENSRLRTKPPQVVPPGWFRGEAGGRALAITLALLIEGLLLLLFLSMTIETRPGEEADAITVVTLDRSEMAEEAPEPISPAAEEEAVASPPPAEEQQVSTLIEPRAAPAAADPVPTSPAGSPPPLVSAPLAPAPLASPPPGNPPTGPARPAPSGRAVYGPPDTGRSASRDTARVGTAPNGEPLYAAAWYREPTDENLRGYLSTASGPGWGLIACRTVPGFRVEDCVGLDEYPQGSQINRAVLAAAWQFEVRPPLLGGVSLVGSWVRIRIDYGLKRR